MTNDCSDFNVLPGLSGTKIPEVTSARFVVLFHDHPIDHWDWMFELAGTLLTFRSIPAPFLEGDSRPFQMTLLAPHRMDYLEYEGPVTGNRGSVKRLEKGMYRWVEKEPHRWVLDLAGNQLKGKLTLQLEKKTKDEEVWEAKFEKTA